jgi:hypothetical protein
VTSAKERLTQRLRGLGVPKVAVEEEPGSCPLCNGPMVVQKSVSRLGRTLEHGTFEARETVHVCAGGCHWPSRALVTRRAASLSQRLLPRSMMGYDVLSFVGSQRFLEHRRRDEIAEALREGYGLDLSSGEVSRLAQLFLNYLERLHDVRAEALRAALASDGGWPMHLDATGEDGRGTLLVVLAGWRQWVLGAWKIPTERADAIGPHLNAVVSRFGAPCAIMRDLGRAMTGAADGLVETAELNIPVLACHLHFLADVGKDLLEPSHDQLRELFRRVGVRPRLRALARDLGLGLGPSIEKARADFSAWQDAPEKGHRLPEGPTGLATVRAVAQWVLDYPIDGHDQGFPFDRPYLDLYRRCTTARRAVDAYLRQPPADRKVLKALHRLRAVLEPTLTEDAFPHVAQMLGRRAELFEELRAALRLTPKPTGRREDHPARPANALKALSELQDIQAAIDRLATSLRERRPERGPAQDTRQAVDLVLRHLETHGKHLWGHAIPLPPETGGGVRLVDRTNNRLEGFFHELKHGERRRSGRKVLTHDFESLPPGAALAQNLSHPDYVAILCGSLDNLPRAFAKLDAEHKSTTLALPACGTQPAKTPAPSLPASASIPREDRAIIRSDALRISIAAAANSRAPRTAYRPPSLTA